MSSGLTSSDNNVKKNYKISEEFGELGTLNEANQDKQ